MVASRSRSAHDLMVVTRFARLASRSRSARDLMVVTRFARLRRARGRHAT